MAFLMQPVMETAISVLQHSNTEDPTPNYSALIPATIYYQIFYVFLINGA